MVVALRDATTRWEVTTASVEKGMNFVRMEGPAEVKVSSGIQ